LCESTGNLKGIIDDLFRVAPTDERLIAEIVSWEC